VVQSCINKCDCVTKTKVYLYPQALCRDMLSSGGEDTSKASGKGGKAEKGVQDNEVYLTACC